MEANEDLLKRIRELATIADPAPCDDGLQEMNRLLRTFVPDMDQRRRVAKLVEGFVYRLVLEGAKSSVEDGLFELDPFPEAEVRSSQIKYFQEHTAITDTRHLNRLCRTIETVEKNRKRDRPSSKKKKQLWKRWKSGCYLCGGKLEGPEARLDHRFPLSAGGANGNANKNLAFAHEDCEYHKWDIAFPGDVAIFRFVFANPPNGLLTRTKMKENPSDEERRDFERAVGFRTAVMVMLGYTNEGQEPETDDQTADIRIGKIDERQPWWFGNSRLIHSMEANEDE